MRDGEFWGHLISHTTKGIPCGKWDACIIFHSHIDKRIKVEIYLYKYHNIIVIVCILQKTIMHTSIMFLVKKGQYDYCKRIPNNTKKNYFVIKTDSLPLCPDCKSKIKIRDSKSRIIKSETGDMYEFHLRRFYCSHCKKIHTEIPDCIKAYKHYSANAIENILNGRCDYYTVDDSTVYRWKRE